MNNKFPTSCKCKNKAYPKYALDSRIAGMNGIYYKTCCEFCAAKFIMEEGYLPDWVETYNKNGEFVSYHITVKYQHNPSVKHGLTGFWHYKGYDTFTQERVDNFIKTYRTEIRHALTCNYLIYSKDGKVLRTRCRPYAIVDTETNSTGLSDYEIELFALEEQEYQFTQALNMYLSGHYSITEEERFRAFNFVINFLFKIKYSYWTKVKR